MKRNLKAVVRRFLTISLCLFAGSVARADDALRNTPFAESGPVEPAASVVVQGVKDPQRISYRVMAAGLDAFADYHALAPAAALQFRLLKRADVNTFASNWDGVRLRLVTDNDSLHLPLASDGSFALPRDETALQNDAELRLNLKRSQVTAEPYVRTPVCQRMCAVLAICALSAKSLWRS